MESSGKVMANALPFEAERLQFRPVASGDEHLLFPHITDATTEHWIGWETPKNLEEERIDVESMLSRMEQDAEAHFIAFDRATGAFVGYCGIERDSKHPEELEINVWISEDAQGRGYGFETVSALIDWARKHIQLPYLVYSVTEGNERSKKIAERLQLPAYRTWTATKRGAARSVTDYKVILKGRST